jgi:hypothetical protein
MNNLTIRFWVQQSLNARVTPDPEGDYKDHAARWQSAAQGFLWDAHNSLAIDRNGGERLTKLELLELGAIRGAIREVQDINAYDCPNAWGEWARATINY